MRALFTISLLELFMGGGGRLIHVGPVSLRMVLFAACLCATVVAIMFPRRESDGLRLALLLSLIYLIIHVGGMLVGAMFVGDGPKIFGEFQQSLYWLAAPFIALMLQRETDVQKVTRLVLISGVTLASVYMGVLLAMATGIASPGLLKAIIGSSGELVFRGGDFFIYKGFLYLGIGIIFLVALRPRFWIPLAVFVGVAQLLTFTRGFLLSTSIALFALLCAQRRWRAAVPALILAGGALFVILVYLPSSDESVGGHYESSTNQRIEDMQYIVDHLSVKTLAIGEGYASLINNRYQIENTFLWAMWKLGLIGLAFWLVPLFLGLLYYFRIPDRRSNAPANAYLFGLVMIYVQTATNPFLNNPIGLSFAIVAIFALRVMARGHAANGHLVPAH
jgi:hypothetical protein